MSRLTFTLLTSCFAFLIASSSFTPLEADDRGRFNYSNERGAWGGNGGWWGDSHYDWYGEYGTREEQHHNSNYYQNRGHYSNPYSPPRGHHYDGYYYNNEYPYGGQYFYDNSVDGGAVYLNFK